MSKLSFSVYLNTYSDSAPSNNPSLNNVKWARDLSGLVVNNPKSEEYQVAPGESRTLFDGIRALLQDGTTEYSLALKPFSTQTYVLSWTAGTAPNFRTPRAIASDATTEVTVTKNGPVVTFTSTAGTNFNFATTLVGDEVTIGSLFNILNQGTFKVIAKTSNSISVENDLASPEGPIVLGAGFADQVAVFSAAGVQVDDTLIINAGFSLVTQGSYKISAVYANSLEFYSASVLPEEDDIQTNVAIYSSAKQLIYMESDSKLSVIVNGGDACDIEPFVINNAVQPGVMMLKSTIYSLEVENNGTDTANLFLIAVE